jgi:hypothetical protein
MGTHDVTDGGRQNDVVTGTLRVADDNLKEVVKSQWEANRVATGGHTWNPPGWADIAEDGIQIVFRKRTFSIPFSRVKEMVFWTPQRLRTRRWWYRVLDPFHRLPGQSKLPIWKLVFRLSIRVPGYSFGFSSRRGDIQIVRSKGLSILLLFFPVLALARWNRVFVLCPADPEEFYEELLTAYKKWHSRSAQQSIAPKER